MDILLHNHSSGTSSTTSTSSRSNNNNSGVFDLKESNNCFNYSAYNSGSGNVAEKVSIYDLPVEILFLIFSVEKEDNEPVFRDEFLFLQASSATPPLKTQSPIIPNSDYLSLTSIETTASPTTAEAKTSYSSSLASIQLKKKNYKTLVDISNNWKDLMKAALNFSMTCKSFYKLFEEENFWYQNYRYIFSYSSTIDVDNKCLSLLQRETGSGYYTKSIDPQYSAGCSNDSKPSSSLSALSASALSLSPNKSQLVARESAEQSQWKHRYFHRKHQWAVDDINCNLKISETHSSGITSLGLDDQYLFSGSHDSNIMVYRLDDLKPVHQFKGHKYTIWSLQSDGKRLYSGSNDHTIRVWDLKNKSLKYMIEDKTKIFSISLAQRYIFSSSDTSIKMWDKKSGTLQATLNGHTGGVNTTYIHQADSSRLLSGSSDKSIRIWDLNTLQCLDSKVDASTKILSMTMVNENLVAIGSQNCQIKLWDLRIDSPVVTINKSHSWDVWQIHMCGGYLFSGSFDHTIKIWDLNNFQNLKTLNEHRTYIHALTSSSFHLFSGSADKTIRIWSENQL